MQNFYSSSKKPKIHFLSANFPRVRDRTACLNSFWFVAFMQTKRVSSDSPTITALKSSVVQRNAFLYCNGNAQTIIIFLQLIIRHALATIHFLLFRRYLFFRNNQPMLVYLYPFFLGLLFRSKEHCQQ